MYKVLNANKCDVSFPNDNSRSDLGNNSFNNRVGYIIQKKPLQAVARMRPSCLKPPNSKKPQGEIIEISSDSESN